ncbi:hypothetical protein ACVWZM_000522 [Bradyrhizobium sp. USDA 4501]|nr:hypothetical protein [Bradyrhizobium elkanii]
MSMQRAPRTCKADDVCAKRRPRYSPRTPAANSISIDPSRWTGATGPGVTPQSGTTLAGTKPNRCRGRVVGLSVFSVGGVIQRSDKILDIVPDEDSLTIEAQVVIEDISDVHPNTRAEVHLTASKQRIVPIIHGDVIQVSADRLTDPKTNNPYYTACVRIDQDELRPCPTFVLIRECRQR